MRLTIRMNASTDDLILDGHTFDRSRLTESERGTMAAMVRDALIASGEIKLPKRSGRRHRRRR